MAGKYFGDKLDVFEERDEKCVGLGCVVIDVLCLGHVESII